MTVLSRAIGDLDQHAFRPANLKAINNMHECARNGHHNLKRSSPHRRKTFAAANASEWIIPECAQDHPHVT